MLSQLRKRAKTFIWIAVWIFVAATFAGLGAYYFSPRADWVAKINGKKISTQDYYNRLYRRMETYRNIYQQEITDEILKQMKPAILSEMIQNILLAAEINRLGIKVTTEEINNEIKSYPVFQKDGRFDQNTYFDILRFRLHSDPATFEQETQNAIAQEKLRRLLTDQITLMDREMEEALKKKLAEKKKPPTLEEKEKLKEEIQRETKNLYWQEYLTSLHSKAKVINNLSKIEQLMTGESTP